MLRVTEGRNKNIVGANVRKYRKLRGLSQQQLADKLETMAVYICRGSISRVEDKLRTVTDIEATSIAETLGVPIEALFAPEE